VAISDINVVILPVNWPVKSQQFACASQLAGQPAGLTEGLAVGSGHENLDRFHLCGTAHTGWAKKRGRLDFLK